HPREASSFDRIVGRFDVARRDEERAANAAAAAIDRPLRDERATETVRGENRRLGTGTHGGIESGYPFIAIGMIEIALLHAANRWMLRFPIRLPMKRAGIPESGNGEDGNAQDAGKFRAT